MPNLYEKLGCTLAVLVVFAIIFFSTILPEMRDGMASEQAIQQARDAAFMQGRSPNQAEADMRDYVARMRAVAGR